VRLFVAAEIGEAVAVRAAELSRELQQRAADAAPSAKVTWIPADRLHLTVRFIGEVDDVRAAAIRDALEAPLGIAPFSLTLAGAGAFPTGGAPRVLWAGVATGRDELLLAEREITLRLASIGVPADQRAYSPHLTLARVRDPAGLRSPRLLDGLTDTTLGTVRIDAITLFHSKLSPKGPTYTPLLRIRLGGSEIRIERV
jgi:2'-5' RNA ligase